MKRHVAILSLMLLFSGVMLTSCGTKDGPENPEFSIQALQAGAWAIDHVDVNTFDTQGNLISTENYPFGEGTEGGICTFTYDKNKTWTLNDNGELFTARYSLDDRIIYTDGGGTWGLRKLDDENLEVVLRSDQTLNPCDYTVNGAVYYLSRAAI